MSKKAVSFVYRMTGMTGPEKSILFVLAIKHDESCGFTQMTAPQIARYACLSDACVRRNLKTLEASGRIDILKAGLLAGNKHVLKGLEGKGKKEVLFDQLFEDFWHQFPRKTAKPAAKKAYFALEPSPDLAVTILQDLVTRMMYVWALSDKKYIPYPSTYINQRLWEDAVELPPEPEQGGVVW